MWQISRGEIICLCWNKEGFTLHCLLGTTFIPKWTQDQTCFWLSNSNKQTWPYCCSLYLYHSNIGARLRMDENLCMLVKLAIKWREDVVCSLCQRLHETWYMRFHNWQNDECFNLHRFPKQTCKINYMVCGFFNSMRKHIQKGNFVMNRAHMINSQRFYAYFPSTTQLHIYICTIQQIYASYNENLALVCVFSLRHIMIFL